jgi:hypothetical protein
MDSMYVDICTDGTLLMVGKKHGILVNVKAIAPEYTSSHCIIHRQAVAVKRLQMRIKWCWMRSERL